MLVQLKLSTTPSGWVYFSLGGDPEFEVVRLRDGQVVRAEDVLEDPDRDYQIGLDGSGDQVELRPEPCDTPSGYVAEISELFRAWRGEFPRHTLSIRGNTYPLGGHVHIGAWEKEDVALIQDNRAVLVKALDLFVGRVLIDTSGSARGGYKALGAYEYKPWGFEYRTPPASFYQDPEMVRVVYKLIFGVVDAVLKGGLEVEVGSSGIPTFKEYLRFLTPEEAQYFLSFPERWEKRREFNYEAWRVLEPRPFTLQFRDDWRDENIEVFVKAFEDLFKDKPIDVYFYGLKKSRGYVFNIPTCPTEVRLSEPPIEFYREGEIWIGLPYEIRMERLPTEEELHSIRAWVEEALKDLL